MAEVSPKKLRTRYLAYLALLRDAGFTVTPFFGSALAFFFTDEDGNDENVVQTPLFLLNMYTSPAYLLFICCVATLLMVVFFLEHKRREVMPKLTKMTSRRLKESSEPPAAVVLGAQKTVLDIHTKTFDGKIRKPKLKRPTFVGNGWPRHKKVAI